MQQMKPVHQIGSGRGRDTWPIEGTRAVGVGNNQMLSLDKEPEGKHAAKDFPGNLLSRGYQEQPDQSEGT